MQPCLSTSLARMYINHASLLALLLTSAAVSSAESMQANQDCAASNVFQRVNALLADKSYDLAGNALDQLRSCPNRSPLETFQLGWLYGRARQFDKALEVLNKVPVDVPDRLTHGYAIALSKFELADYSGAAGELKSLQSAGLADTKSINLLAVSYSKVGLYREAYQALAEQINKDPSDLSLYLNIVAVCAEKGDFAKAADLAAQATQKFPTSADAFIVHGAANSLLGFLDRASDDFATAVHLAPERPDARFFLALTGYKQGRFGDALTVLQRAVKDGLADSDLHYLIAECLLKLDPTAIAEALRELSLAIDLNANSVSARTLRGKLLLAAGRTNDAVSDLETAIHKDPNSRAALYNLAMAYKAAGRTSEAQALFLQIRTQATEVFNEFSAKRLNEALGENGAQP
jgi:tetratricopeptide (TPR) repeat protein